MLDPLGRPSVNPELVLTNFDADFNGVSATIANLAEQHEQRFTVVILGKPLPVLTKCLSRWKLPLLIWRKPPGRRVRIWHARRTSEMLLGLVLRRVLRARIKLVGTMSSMQKPSSLASVLAKRMDAVIATTPEVAAYFQRVDAIIPHGIDTRLFAPPEKKSRAWQETRLPGKFGIGMFGHINAQKGTDLFIDAMCRLLPQYPDFAAIVGGLCKDKDKNFQKSLVTKTAKAGIAERVIWLGEVPPAERHKWFQRLSLYVAPARHEDFGLTGIEAMACGTPMVATKTGIYPDLIKDGRNGYLAEVENIDDLIARIEVCLRDPLAMQQMGLHGRKRIVADFDITKEAAAIEDIYQRIFDEKRK